MANLLGLKLCLGFLQMSSRKVAARRANALIAHDRFKQFVYGETNNCIDWGEGGWMSLAHILQSED